MTSTDKSGHAKASLPMCAGDTAFCIACALLFAIICLALPSYFPTMQPDSGGYLTFALNRTAMYPLFLRELRAFGLTLEGIVYVQVSLFALSVAILASSLSRWDIKRRWIVLLTILLAANSYFSSFQRTILTESIGFSAIIVATGFLLDYLRTGRIIFLTIAGFFVGLTIGIRPAGLVIAPMILVAALLKRNTRDCSIVVLLVGSIVPLLAGWTPERIIYRVEHGSLSASVLPYILSGKAAMLAEPGITYKGMHDAALKQLGDKLVQTYSPVHVFLSGLPSWVAWPTITAFYEAAAQFQVINRDLVRLAAEYGTTPENLAVELGEQTILSNPIGFLRLSLIHYVGQWSITALTFPPAAKAVNTYRESVPEIPLYAEVTSVPFTPQANWKSYFTYPAFLLAGVITLVLVFFLPSYLLWPSNADSSRGQSIMVAVFFATMCHSSMLLTSFVNVSTPRFLMMVYPHILLAALFLLRATYPHLIGAQSASGPDRC